MYELSNRHTWLSWFMHDLPETGTGTSKHRIVSDAIKYVCRFGQKDGRNRKDLLKAVHYIVLLMNSEDQGDKK